MTDNEKAATFIGEFGRECSKCRRNILHDVHPPLVPDMSDPRNYMKALEAVRQSKRGSYRLSSGELVAGLPIFCIVSRESCEGVGRETHEGRAIIKALVALYGAEHPE